MKSLASELSVMVQDPSESIDQFAFKYKNVLHQLDKLGENISKACPTYVTLQFISKLQPHIAQHIVLQADQITSLDKAIEAARRIEQSFTTPTSKSPTSNSPGSASTSTLADWKPERSALGRFPFKPKFWEFWLVHQMERTISVWSDRNIIFGTSFKGGPL